MYDSPKALKVPYSLKIHDEIIEDDYFWLRDKDWPDVKNIEILNYLDKENNYFQNYFESLIEKKEEIFQELKGRIKLTDQSTFIKRDSYYYYSRVEEDKQHVIYCRRKGSKEAAEEIILDVNELAKGKKFTNVGSIAVSPKHNLLAYSVDFTGGEKYTIKVHDLDNNKYLQDEIPNTFYDIIWHERINGFFYTPSNGDWRHDKIMFHRLGTDIKEDKLIFREPDPLFQVATYKSSSKEYIFINVNGHSTNEIHYIDMNDDEFVTNLIFKSEENIFYDVDHREEYFYIRTNKDAQNYKVIRFKPSDTINFEEYILEQENLYLSSFDITKNYLILNYNKAGLALIKIFDFNSLKEKIISFPDAAYTAKVESVNYEEDDIRVNYSSIGRTSTVYSYDFNSDKLDILKVAEIPSGFNPDEYIVERVFASNRDVEVPISLFYKKSTFKGDGSNPLFLCGYGAYGISLPASFRSSAISIADRGFVYALAHVRGGDELGQGWYEAAKYLNKKNTFNDFIASAEHLIEKHYTSKGNIVIWGGSAGGMLVGNVINQKPELFKAAIAHVPFVDVLNTMLDESLSLTPGEFKEWGNPKDKEYFDYIKSYCPYNNVRGQDYPALFITAGLSDPRVGYWEAAKWVAKLRSLRTNDSTLIYKTNMEAGHKGATGRFDYLYELAEELVFVFKEFKVNGYIS